MKEFDLLTVNTITLTCQMAKLLPEEPWQVEKQGLEQEHKGDPLKSAKVKL